ADVEERAQCCRREDGDGEVKPLLQARRKKEKQGPEGGQGEGGQGAASAVEGHVAGEEQENRGHESEMKERDGIGMPTEDAPERSVKYREQRAVGAEV